MIVVDASVLVDLVLRTCGHEEAARRVLRDDAEVHAPHLVDIEVTSALRRRVLSGRLPPREAEQALEFYRSIPIRRYGAELVLAQILDYRDNLTAYDAAYVVLAEVLDAPLVTFDASLAAAPGHGARVEVLTREG